jgi:hypothetical protein
MAWKLGEADRRAVDLVLNKDFPKKGQTGQFVAPIQTTPERVDSVEKILSLLQELPIAEPPADLARKTLKRVDKALAALGPRPGDQPMRDDRPIA